MIWNESIWNPLHIKPILIMNHHGRFQKGFSKKGIRYYSTSKRPGTQLCTKSICPIDIKTIFCEWAGRTTTTLHGINIRLIPTKCVACKLQHKQHMFQEGKWIFLAPYPMDIASTKSTCKTVQCDKKTVQESSWINNEWLIQWKGPRKFNYNAV